MTRIRDLLIDTATLAAAVCAVALTLAVGWQHFESDSRRSRFVEDWEQYARAGHQLGATDPTVTLVWWGDYECPFCRKLAPAVEGLLDQYGDRVAVIYRHWPLNQHPAGLAGAKAAFCADTQGRFWPVHQLLFSGTDWLSDPDRGILKVAEEAGIPDLVEFERCRGDASVDRMVEADISAIKGLGANGVPMLLLDGQLLGTVPDSLELLELIGARLRS